jgi:hypothetical protein
MQVREACYNHITRSSLDTFRVSAEALPYTQSVIYGTLKILTIQQPQKAQLSHLPWRNWLARSTVRFGLGHFGYREVDSSSLSGRAPFCTFLLLINCIQHQRFVMTFLTYSNADSRKVERR